MATIEARSSALCYLHPIHGGGANPDLLDIEGSELFSGLKNLTPAATNCEIARQFPLSALSSSRSSDERWSTVSATLFVRVGQRSAHRRSAGTESRYYYDRDDVFRARFAPA